MPLIRIVSLSGIVTIGINNPDCHRKTLIVMQGLSFDPKEEETVLEAIVLYLQVLPALLPTLTLTSTLTLTQSKI